MKISSSSRPTRVFRGCPYLSYLDANTDARPSLYTQFYNITLVGILIMMIIIIVIIMYKRRQTGAISSTRAPAQKKSVVSRDYGNIMC